MTRPQVRSTPRFITDTATSKAPRTIRYQAINDAGVVYTPSRSANNTAPVAANNTAVPAFNHHVLIPTSARTTSHSAPKNNTAAPAATTSAGVNRSTHHPIANHAAPANSNNPHMLSRTAVRDEKPDHNIRPPNDGVPAMTTSTAAPEPAFAQIHSGVRDRHPTHPGAARARRRRTRRRP